MQGLPNVSHETYEKKDDEMTMTRKKTTTTITTTATEEEFRFCVEDYIAPTPQWGQFGSEEEGFDPVDTRHRRKGKNPKYTKFDSAGIPTHDRDGLPLKEEEMEKFRDIMERRREEIVAETRAETSAMSSSSGAVKEGEDSGVRMKGTGKGGAERAIDDASLMFRGLVVV